jgi:hypothetical protein
MQVKKKLLLYIAFIFALGCGATLGTIIATVLSVVQDGALIINEIESFVNAAVEARKTKLLIPRPLVLGAIR